MSRLPIRLPDSRSKYRAVRTNGFDSKREADTYENLKLLEKSGIIKDLCADKKQLRYDLEVNGVKICTYVADFRYTVVAGGAQIVEDVKGVKTPAYRLKKKLMKAIHGIEIRES